MDDTTIKEEIKGKQGPELFRELLRQLPMVFLEDYYKNGVWQNDLMRLDIQILAAHKMEAGAPDPPPLSEVQMPEVPQSATMLLNPSTMLRTAGGALTAPTIPHPGGVGSLAAPTISLQGLAGTVVRPPGMATALIPGLAATGPTGVGLVAPSRPGALTATAGFSGAASDLRQIALFVSKWRLDAARTAPLLMKLTSPRRHFVMQTFKDPSCVNGAAVPVEKLEEYIAQCQRGPAWAALGGVPIAGMKAASPGIPSTGNVIAPPGPLAAGGVAAAGGVKRPFEQTLAWAAALPKAGPVAGQTVLPPGQQPMAKMRPAASWAR